MTRSVLLFLIAILAGCTQPPIGDADFADGSVQQVVRAGDVPWMDCPPTLPTGCQMAVLEGSPQEADLFTVRFKVGGSFHMPPHTHPKDERVTVLTGSVAVAFGPETTREEATRFGPGDYYVNARDAVHSVWADGHTVLQITGIGPWEADFIDD